MDSNCELIQGYAEEIDNKDQTIWRLKEVPKWGETLKLNVII